MHPNSTRVLTATRCGEALLLSYQLGLAEGLTLLSPRDSETDLSPLSEDEPSPAVDDRPKLVPARPETRFYRAVLRYNGGETRQLSEEIRLTLP